MSVESELEMVLGEFDGTIFTVKNHVAAALRRLLPQQFRSADQEQIEKLVRIFVNPFQEIEEAFQDLIIGTMLDSATGVVLGYLGALCGEPSDRGADDDTYRRRIRARITTNRASGLIEEYITIARLIVYDDAASIRTERQNHSTMLVSIEDVAITDEVGAILFEFLDAATPGDQRVILQYGTVDPAELFHFDSGPGLDEGILATSL